MKEERPRANPAKWRGLYTELRNQILRGQIAPGVKLPSTRSLAEERSISRSTVLAAYEQLLAEGFLEASEGSGTYVAKIQRSPEHGTAKQRSSKEVREPLFQSILLSEANGLIDFRSGQPDLSVFPWGRWEKAERSARLKYGAELLRYGRPEGLPALRKSIASYLGRSRGLEVDPERLIVCNGTTQAIAILGEIFATRGVSTVWLEDPVTADIAEIFRGKNLAVKRVPVDGEGILSSILSETLTRNTGGNVVFVTPSHQFPTGAVLSLRRRLELITLVNSRGGWLIEDDYDSEFRFSTAPLATLASLDPARVVYVGTFSKTLAPGLRTAYIHLPEDLVESGRAVKWKTDLHSPPLIQAALAEFLENRFYDRHVRTMRRHYKSKRDLIVAFCNSEIPGVDICGGEAGMHVVLKLRNGFCGGNFERGCRNAGVIIYPVSAHTADPGLVRNDLILGYGHLELNIITEGLKRLKKVIEDR